MAIYAGPVAEARYCRQALDDVLERCEGDADKANDVLSRWFCDGVSEPIKTANCIFASLTAIDRARALIRSDSGWAAIQGIAAALVVHGEIDGAEIDRICSEVYGGRRPTVSAWAEAWPPTLAQLRAGYVPDIRHKAAA